MKQKELSLKANQFEGYAVTVEIEGNTQEYAMALLHIFNNVRESGKLLSLENYEWNNNITVYCVENSKDELVEYLESFGTIKSCNKVLCYQINECWLPERDYDKYYNEIVVPYFD